MEHDIHAMLRQNRAREQQHGLKEVEIRPVQSRRKRDFWLLLGVGNALFGTIALLGRNNAFVLVSALSGAVIFSAGVTWIIWFVMSDY